MADDLERFVTAQDHVHAAVVEELRRGHKTGHWMWFVFPQIAGLGRSETSRYYALRSRDEARAYVAHPVLGARLRECSAALLEARGSAVEILGAVDAAKLRSSMTLFMRAAPEEPLFGRVLERFFGGVPDPATDEILGRG